MGRGIFLYIRLLKAPSNLILNTSKDGASTHSLGNLFQGLNTLTINNFFLVPNLNLLSYQFKIIALCPVTGGPSKKTLSAFPVSQL